MKHASLPLHRRQVIGVVVGAAAWPLTARAQQVMPVIGLIDPRSPYLLATPAQGFRQGLKDTGYIDRRRARADAAPNCSNAELPAIVVYYGSEPGFLGTDTFILEVQGEGSAPSRHKFNVTVAGMIQ